MSAEDPTTAELLRAVNAAIYSLVTDGASQVSINGRAYTANDLGQLMQLKKELTKLNRSASSMVRLGDISGKY